MRGRKVLVDTSVWIDYFREKNRALQAKVDEVIDFYDVCVPRIVLAELIQGAKTDKEIAVIEEFSRAFTVIDQSEDTWIAAGKLSFTMKRKGVTVNLVDCYISILANENKCAVLTLDEHFKSIAKFIKIDLMPYH